jgi:signal transduction histidine kinase
LHDALEGALQEIDAILETFGALLRIAQIESGARKAGFVELELEEVLRTVIEVYQPALEEKGQTLTETIDEGLRVRGDRELLSQLFANLLENATRHSPAGAHIEVSARCILPRIEARVADNGQGIPEPLRSKVTQRFFRMEQSRTTPGNGLGLSLVAAIAGLHDAALELSDNHPGLRATVHLRAENASG